VASTLVVLDCLGDGASDHHRVALVVIISVVNCLKVILRLDFIRLLEGKVVHAEVLRSLTVVGSTLSTLSLRDELFLRLRGVVNLILVTQLDTGGLHVLSRQRVLPEELHVLPLGTDCFLVH
jgi:hypothetical protein